MSRLLAIANARAGTADDTAIETVLDVLAARHAVELVRTESPDDLADALRRHAQADGVVVLGGDGSLHAVVQALYDADRLDALWIALVPLGTGNDFARTVGLPTEPEEAARLVLNGTPHLLDLALTGDGAVVVNAVHVGIGSDAAAAAAPWKKLLGPLGYALGSAVAGLTRRAPVLRVRVDGRVVTTGRPVLQVAAGVGRYVGGGAELLPEAEPADGLIDVAVSLAAPPLRRLGYALRLRRGDHPRRDDVIYLRGREVVVTGAPVRATNDGELGEPATKHVWTVLPGAWRLVCPGVTG